MYTYILAYTKFGAGSHSHRPALLSEGPAQMQPGFPRAGQGMVLPWLVDGIIAPVISDTYILVFSRESCKRKNNSQLPVIFSSPHACMHITRFPALSNQLVVSQNEDTQNGFTK